MTDRGLVPNAVGIVPVSGGEWRISSRFYSAHSYSFTPCARDRSPMSERSAAPRCRERRCRRGTPQRMLWECACALESCVLWEACVVWRCACSGGVHTGMVVMNQWLEFLFTRNVNFPTATLTHSYRKERF